MSGHRFERGSRVRREVLRADHVILEIGARADRRLSSDGSARSFPVSLQVGSRVVGSTRSGEVFQERAR
jgi:hypothetical protein